MPAFDEVRHAADHVPGAHEALQVDRRVQSGRVGGAGRWRLAGGHGGARQRQGQQHGAERADRNHAGAGSSGLARAWSTVCTRSVNGVAVREKALAHAVLHCPPEKPHEPRRSTPAARRAAGGAGRRGTGAGLAGRTRQQRLAGLAADVAGGHAAGGVVGTAAFPAAAPVMAAAGTSYRWTGAAPSGFGCARSTPPGGHGLTFDTGATATFRASVPRLMTAWSCNVTTRFRLPAGRHDDRCLGGDRRGR
ncbi:hypothetical protein G6F22_015600 [Rhizopus arrhizus]|nr:hypothetical protein G6F22_015600 [Rhizopus arrhizus]